MTNYCLRMGEKMLDKVGSLSIGEYLKEIGEFIEGSSFECTLAGVSALNDPLPETLIWTNNKDCDCEKINFGAIIAPVGFPIVNDKIVFIVKKPRYAFARVVNKFFIEQNRIGIALSAKLSEDVKLGKNISIGDNVVIGKKCQIGDNVTINSNVVLYDDVNLGNNVVIESGTVLGSSGFGIVKDEHGMLYRFPHVGGIVIEDNVEIGANCCVDKGTIGNTIIKNGTKLDNLCHVAHNVTVGTNCIITAKCEISGSVKIGNNVWLSPSTTVIDGISIGNDVFVAIGTVVTKDIGNNMKAMGYPMKLRNNN